MASLPFASSNSTAIRLRDRADLMGHDIRAHIMKHYGAWTTDADKKDSVARSVGMLTREALSR